MARVSRATRRSYDRVAARYAAEIGGELAAKPLDRARLSAFAELTDGLPSGPAGGRAAGPVLDVGAGPGQVARFLSHAGVGTVATDLSPAMCAQAARTGSAAVASDMTALPFASGVAAGIVCLYAVIHLDAEQRALAYASFARVLRPGGHVLLAFHTSDADVPTGGENALTSWWDSPVDLTFRFLDPAAECASLQGAGFELVARLDREPGPDEHRSCRSYLLMRSSDDAPH